MLEFVITVSYVGSLDYIVEADDERSAAKEGLAKFHEASLEDISEAAEADYIEINGQGREGGYDYFPVDLLEAEMRGG